MNSFPEVPEPERRVDAAGGDESLSRVGGDVRQLNNIVRLTASLSMTNK